MTLQTEWIAGPEFKVINRVLVPTTFPDNIFFVNTVLLDYDPTLFA